jgi:fructose-bisphosphate aldolase class II
MSDSTAHFIENCQNARKAMRRARDQHFALGAFNIDNQETLIAVSRAAKAKNAPLMVEVTEGEVKVLGLKNIRDMVDNYKAEYGIEMYLNLDHSPSVEAAKAGIDAGFEFIHIDISQSNHGATHEEIVTATKEIVAYAAHTTGASVESEPHYFGGGSNVFTESFDYEEIKKTFTTPQGAKTFVTETGIDTFAAAIGNLHGHYPVPKQLDIPLLAQIREVIDCNISLHGGSDTPAHYFAEAINIGVSKININSDMRKVYRETLEQILKDNPQEFAIVKIIGTVIDAVQAVVEEKLDIFLAAGKALPKI